MPVTFSPVASQVSKPFAYLALVLVPWVPEVFFSRCSDTDTSSEAAGHNRDITDTGNRARKTSGTQGIVLGALRHLQVHVDTFVGFYYNFRQITASFSLSWNLIWSHEVSSFVPNQNNLKFLV